MPVVCATAWCTVSTPFDVAPPRPSDHALLQVGSAGGARNSVVYNENAFLLSARSMVNSVRTPPWDFRPLMQVRLI